MAGVLSACSGAWDVEGLKASKTSGNAFDQALRDEYVALAAAERAEYDWRDTATFVERGKLAAAGASPAPEAISARDLPEGKVAELTAARAQLMPFLTAEYKAAAPKPLAAAQAGYECWMQEQEENWQLDDIAACRKKFDDAIKALKDVERLKAQPYVVYFALNSAKLQGDALAVIKEAATAFKAAKAARADIAGHADTSGKASINDRFVVAARRGGGRRPDQAGGFRNSAITISAFGESDLR